jgi:hemolysin III
VGEVGTGDLGYDIGDARVRHEIKGDLAHPVREVHGEDGAIVGNAIGRIFPGGELRRFATGAFDIGHVDEPPDDEIPVVDEAAYVGWGDGGHRVNVPAPLKLRKVRTIGLAIVTDMVSEHAYVTPSSPLIPRYRGLLHLRALVALAPVLVVLLLLGSTARDRIAALFFVGGLVTMFGVSAAYHRGSWSPSTKHLLQRFDHSTIFAAIGGTYTAFTVLALRGVAAVVLLAIVWGGTAVGIALQWRKQPPSRALSAAIYAIVGWAALPFIVTLHQQLSTTAFAGLVLGGLAYTAGAVVYATKRPNPSPSVFGFHEVFHACTIVGATLHFIAVALTINA